MDSWSFAALLPGLWTSALALLVLAALRRWFDPVPWTVAAVFAGVVLVLLAPFLVGGGVLLPLDMVMKYPPWRGLPLGDAGFNPLHHDHVMQIVPAQAAVRQVTAAGEWPLWNPWLAAGQPLLADPLSQPFQPLVVAARPLPLATSLGVTAALRLFLALVGTFLLLRRLGVGGPGRWTGWMPAVAGALGWGLGGWMVQWLGWHQATVGAVLPWLLYALDRTAEAESPSRRRDLVLLVGVLLTLLTAGHPETIVYALLAGGVFSLVRLAAKTGWTLPGLRIGSADAAGVRSDRRGGPEGGGWDGARRNASGPDGPGVDSGGLDGGVQDGIRGERYRTRAGRGRQAARLLVRQARAGLVALALAAPVLLPFVQYLPQMVRYQRVEGGRLAAREAGPFRGWRTPEERRASLEGAEGRLLAVVAPGSFGGFTAGGYHGPTNSNEDLTGYAGGALLLAALLALWPARRRLPGERFFVGLLLLGLLVLARPPGLLPLIERLPGLGHSPSQHHRVLMLVGFAVAAAGACLLERWRRGDGPPRAVVATAGVLAAATISWSTLAAPEFGQAHPAEAGWPQGWRLAWMVAELTAVAGLTVLLLSGRTGRRRGGDAERPADGAAVPPVGILLAATVALLVAGELLLLHLPLHPPAPARLFYPATAVSELLQSRLAAVGERVERDPASPPAQGLEEPDRMRREGTALHPTTAGTPAAPRAFGRFTALGPTYPANTAVLAGLMDVRSSGPAQPAPFSRITELLKPPGGAWGDVLGVADSPVYDLLGVRYLLAWPDAAVPPPARPVLQASAPGAAAGAEPVIRVYERPGALPLIFLPRSAEAWVPGSEWREWIFTHGDYEARSLVHFHPRGQAVWRAAEPAASRVRSIALDPARLAVEVDLAEERLLATSLYQDGQWRLLLDGLPAPPVHANGPFVAAWVPAGTERVEVLYRPSAFVAGCLLAGLGWAAAFAFLASPPRRRRAA